MRNAQQLLAGLSAGRWDAAFASLYGCAGRSAADCRARYARLVEGFTAAFGGTFLFNAATVALGELIVCYVLGLPLLALMTKTRVFGAPETGLR